MKHKASKNEKGISLILTMLTLMIILVIAFGVANLMLGQIKMAREVPRSLRAYYAAEVGIEKSLYDARRGGGASDIGDPANLANCSPGTIGVICLDDPEVCYSVDVDDSGDPVIIKSYGCYRQIKRSVEVSY